MLGDKSTKKVSPFQKLAWMGGFLGGLAAIVGLVISIVDWEPESEIVFAEYIRLDKRDLIYRLGRKDDALMEELGWPDFLDDKVTTKFLHLSSKEYTAKNKAKLSRTKFLLVKNIGAGSIDKIELYGDRSRPVGTATRLGSGEGFLVCVYIEFRGETEPIEQRIKTIAYYGKSSDGKVDAELFDDGVHNWRDSSKFDGLARAYPR